MRARFAFTDDDLETITRWVREANVRWGFDNEHRRRTALPVPQNTWRFGLDRVLSGVAMSDDSNGLAGRRAAARRRRQQRIELAGRLAEFVDRLPRVVDALGRQAAGATGSTRCSDGVGMLTRLDGDDAWQARQLKREFGRSASSGRPAGRIFALRLSDIRALLAVIWPAGRRGRTSAPGR